MTFADTVALHLRLDGIVVDQETLRAQYDTLCQGGHPLACKWRAWDEWGRVKGEDLMRLGDAACKAGDTDGCAIAALARAAPDPAGALERLRPLCDGGSGRACLEAGRLAVAGFRNTDPDPAGGAALRAKACALGEDEGCDHPAPAPAPSVGCKAGRLSACEAALATATGDDRLRALELLCHTGTHCDALATTRAAAAGAWTLPPGRPVAHATWVTGGVLLGWDAPTFLDHVWVPIADLTHADLQVGGSRDETFRLVPKTGDPIALPDEGCDAAISGSKALAAAGTLARAQDATGAPRNSDCIDSLAPGTPYMGGRLAVTPKAAGVDPTPMRDALAGGDEGLWACGEAQPADGHVKGWIGQLVQTKAGPAAKTETLTSSGNAAYDQCLATWLGTVDLPATPFKAIYTVRIDLVW